MSKEEVGRELIFQMGVKFIEDKIQDEFSNFIMNCEFNKANRKEVIEFFRSKYYELKMEMPFLKIIEYPRVVLYLDEPFRLKVHLQGWLHNIEDSIFLGGMKYNKNVFYDFYCKKIEFGFELCIRYGDSIEEVYKKIYSNFSFEDIKWNAIKKSLELYRDENLNFLSLNPTELLNESEVK